MSEVKNSTTDIDNNVQEQPAQKQEPAAAASPAQTPRKRMSRAEKAHLESEELLKSLGVSIESGRQTRSSRRGPVVESPKPEPAKRKQTSTPRRPKKAKVSETDSTDGANHVEGSNQDEPQIVPSQAENSGETEKIETVEKEAVVAASNSTEAEVEQMQVDTPIESTQPETSEPAENVPASKASELLLPAPIVQVDSVPSKIVEQPGEFECSGVSAATDTTTAIVIDSEPTSDEPSQNNDEQPIELNSSPSDEDSKEPVVTNSQVVSQPDAFVELESSSNEGETFNKLSATNAQESDSLDFEMINSDSSHSANEVQNADIPASQAAPEQPVSTTEPEVIQATEVTEIVDEPTNNNTNNNANESVATSEVPENSVKSTNNQPIEIPDKSICTITVENPIDETITTTSTSETLLQPNATTV